MNSFQQMLLAGAYKNNGKITSIMIEEGHTSDKNKLYLIKDTGAIEWIVKNTHRYLGTMQDDIMILRQLDDTDSRLYNNDKTTAPITTIGNDVFVRIPTFWYKCDDYGCQPTSDSDLTEEERLAIIGTNNINLHISTSYKKGWNKWDGDNNLIGAYEAYIENNKCYSVSGKQSTDSVNQANFKAYARNRGKGYFIITWEAHTIIGILYYFYAAWMNKLGEQYFTDNSKLIDSQACMGYNSHNYTNITGLTDSWGMHRSYPISSGQYAGGNTANGNGSLNLPTSFLGIENVWGNKYEWIDNVYFNLTSIDYVYHIRDPFTEQDIRTFSGIKDTAATGNCVKMLWGKHLDLIQGAITNGDGNYNTGYCDFVTSYQNSTNKVATRSGYYAYPYCGAAFSAVLYGPADANVGFGSRLLYKGIIKIIN